MDKNRAIIPSSAQPSPLLYSNFLITGANFGNKGAQSMLFTTASELRKRFPSCNVYYATTENYPEEKYTFRKINYSSLTERIAFGGFDGFMTLFKRTVKDIVKLIIGRRNIMLGHYRELSRLMQSLTAVVDISGFAFSSKWGYEIMSGYCRKISLAEKYNVPVYLMPQSFGPFDYPQEVLSDLKRSFSGIISYPRIIFTREKQGFDDMAGLLGLKNIRMSSDLVLQSKNAEVSDVFSDRPAVSVPRIDSSKGLAGIVPNMRCFDHVDQDNILSIYRGIVHSILEQGYKIVLFRHSAEDIEACRLIKEFYPDDENVQLIENDFDCLEYTEFVKQFKFLVCSRYHGLVHAYRNNIPCVALGWAEKYHSLAEILGQGNYVFDITSSNTHSTEIISAILRLLTNYDAEKITIREKLAEIQKSNCFDILENDLRNLWCAK